MFAIQTCRPPVLLSISINGTLWSSWSFAYRALAMANCRMLFRQPAPWALFLALAKAGNSSAARIAMIAMTTSNSISVKPPAKRLAKREWMFVFILFDARFSTVDGPSRSP